MIALSGEGDSLYPSGDKGKGGFSPLLLVAQIQDTGLMLV